MNSQLKLQCTCGGVQAVIDPHDLSQTCRVICHCRWCQQYAHFLNRQGDMLDQRGGSDVFQVSPARLRITQGVDKLAWVQQLPKRGSVRWYADCCKTPLANTLPQPTRPFIAISRLMVQSVNDGPLDELIGPVYAQVNHKIPRAEAKALRGNVGALFGMLRHYAPLFFRWWWRGDGKRSPFVDSNGELLPATNRKSEPPMSA